MRADGLRWLIASGALATATAMTWVVRDLADETLFAAHVAAAAIAARFGGWRIAAIVVVASAIVIDLLFVAPRWALSIPTRGTAVTLGAFVAASACVIALVEALERARHRAERLARDAEEARAAAERADAAKSSFLSAVSHELRTPLHALLGFADLLEEELMGPLLPRQKRYVGRMRAAGRHLLALVNDLLDL
ncbi:MAG TPA: histidine kinase dimerization/phospho-acceptor domain-containing protein, partial [Gemmatimonadaceae bacterium]|nr:histidine kinase dimerization/phospho-acceptor domain-containing protein [Gemmatimonadaceae bacterium]